MWVAKQQWENYGVAVRINGKFTASTLELLVPAIFEYGWNAIRHMLAVSCRNKAAVALLDGNIPDAEIWIARSRAIKEIE